MSYIKIYFGTKPVFLCDELTEELDLLKEKKDTIYQESLSNYILQAMPKDIEKPEYNAGIIFHDDLAQLKEVFFDQFQVIQAGGGVVYNEKEEILLIFRNGKWDLPKGKADEGEDIEECAAREVKEETGLKEVSVGPKSTITWHVYSERGTLILKETHWYLMTATVNAMLIPQVAEGITEILWADKSDLPKYTVNTFPAIIDVLEASTS